MANILKRFLRHTFFAKYGNLVALDNPYSAIGTLLRDYKINGIIDAGASYGRVSQRLLRLFPSATLYAFEANTSYRDQLEQVAEEDKRFRPYFCALSNRSGTAKLHVTRSAGSTSLYKLGERIKKLYPDGSSVVETREIPMTTLDDWANTHNNPPVELIKFDIQGGELDALKGANAMLTSSTLLVYVEVLFNPLYEGGAIFSDLDKQLRTVDFVLYNIYKPNVDKNGQLLYANAIYIHSKRLSLDLLPQ